MQIRKMKQISSLAFFSILLTFIFSSCEDFHDDNGDLGGMWQMTQWYTRSTGGQIDSLVTTNEEGLYFSFHQRLVQLSKFKPENTNDRSLMFGHFKHTSDSLFIYDVVKSNSEPALPEELAWFGIEQGGGFHIDTFTADKMVLSNKVNMLVFRKY